jgi:hypothetical protein
MALRRVGRVTSELVGTDGITEVALRVTIVTTMLARDDWKAVTVDRADLLDRVTAVLRDDGTRLV